MKKLASCFVLGLFVSFSAGAVTPSVLTLCSSDCAQGKKCSDHKCKGGCKHEKCKNSHEKSEDAVPAQAKEKGV